MAFIVNKRIQNTVLECGLKDDRIISVHFQGKPFNITVIQVYDAPTTNAEETEIDWFCEDLQDLLELGSKKDVFFLIGDWKSGDSWSNRQVWPWSTERSRTKANRARPREHTGHRKHPLPTT